MALRQRLASEELAFLTNDTEFEELAGDCRAQVIISRLPQRLPTSQRVEIKLFDLMPDGEILAWEIRHLRRDHP